MENSDVGQALRTRSLCRHNSPVLVVSSDDQGLKMKRDWESTRPGLEHPAKTSGKVATANPRAAKSGAIQPGRIVELDELPADKRKAIEAILSIRT